MLLALGLLSLASPPADIVTRWDAPRRCPARAAVEQRLRREQQGRDDAGFAVAATISRDAGGFRLRGEVTLDGRAQPIRLSHGKSCDALVDKLILYLVPLLPDPPAPPPVAAPPAPPRPRGYLRGAFEGDLGGLRSCRDGACGELMPTAGGLLAGGWIRGRLRVELGVPLHTRAAAVPATGPFGELAVRWLRTGLQLRICGARERARFELLLCGELGLQLLLGAPRSDDPGFEPATAVLPWASLRLGLAGVWWFHPRLGLRLDAAPGLNLRPREYRVFDRLEDDPQVHRPLAEVGLPHAVVALGLDVRLGPRPQRR